MVIKPKGKMYVFKRGNFHCHFIFHLSFNKFNYIRWKKGRNPFR